MSPRDPAVRWLLAGDPAIRWQVMADLLGETGAEAAAERARVVRAGWGARLLMAQAADGMWGGGLYTPKWTSTTYTLLLLRWLGLPGANPRARTGTILLLDEGIYRDNGINFWRRWIESSETCVTGMVLALAACFAPDGCKASTGGSITSPWKQPALPAAGTRCALCGCSRGMNAPERRRLLQ
ncbi:MAG: hypothetical protein ACE15B_21215 [Bryobacteraceae bacterium]